MMARANHSTLQRRARIAEALLFAIVVLGAILVGRIILAGPLFANKITVNLDLPEVAGLHDHSDVAYRGQHVGVVTSVRLTDTGARATIRLDGQDDIPRDSEFFVANLSAVGEQYVDIRPRTASGPYLAEGDTISASGVPVPTWKVLGDAQHLLKRVDSKDLETIGNEIEALFGQGNTDLPGLITEVKRTIDMLERVSPTVLALIHDGRKPLATVDDLAPDVKKLITNARKITKALRGSNKTIDSLLDDGATLVPVLVEDFDSVEPALVRMLADGSPVATMARQHLPGLKHWYKWGPAQLVAMAEGTRDKSGHVILVITPADSCRYGREYSPYDKRSPLLLNAKCTSTDPAVNQRGAQWAPKP